MRTKEEILRSGIMSKSPKSERKQLLLILEVLVDLRDLLEKK